MLIEVRTIKKVVKNMNSIANRTKLKVLKNAIVRSATFDRRTKPKNYTV